jgi:hypothetical protein
LVHIPYYQIETTPDLLSPKLDSGCRILIWYVFMSFIQAHLTVELDPEFLESSGVGTEFQCLRAPVLSLIEYFSY